MAWTASGSISRPNHPIRSLAFIGRSAGLEASAIVGETNETALIMERRRLGFELS